MDSIGMRVSIEFKRWCEKMKELKKQQTQNREEWLSDSKITKLITKHREITPLLEAEILNFSWGGK